MTQWGPLEFMKPSQWIYSGQLKSKYRLLSRAIQLLQHINLLQLYFETAHEFSNECFRLFFIPFLQGLFKKAVHLPLITTFKWQIFLEKVRAGLISYCMEIAAIRSSSASGFSHGESIWGWRGERMALPMLVQFQSHNIINHLENRVSKKGCVCV